MIAGVTCAAMPKVEPGTGWSSASRHTLPLSNTPRLAQRLLNCV